MMGGDISNELPPRLMVIVDGLLMTLPPDRETRYARLRATRRAVSAVDCWEINQDAITVMWDWMWRRGYKIDLVTFISGGTPLTPMGRSLRNAVKDRLSEADVPHSNLMSYASPLVLQSRLAYFPDVVHVVHGDTANPFAYGSKGTLVGPNNPMARII